MLSFSHIISLTALQNLKTDLIWFTQTSLDNHGQVPLLYTKFLHCILGQECLGLQLALVVDLEDTCDRRNRHCYRPRRHGTQQSWLHQSQPHKKTVTEHIYVHRLNLHYNTYFNKKNYIIIIKDITILHYRRN